MHSGAPRAPGSCEGRAEAEGTHGDFWACHSQAQPGKSRPCLGAAAHRDGRPCPTGPVAPASPLTGTPGPAPGGARSPPGAARSADPLHGGLNAVGFESAAPRPRPPTDYKSHGALRRWPRGTPGAVLGARPPPIRRQPRRRAVRQCVAPHRAVKRESAPFRRLSPPRFAAAPCGSGGWRLCPGGRRPETERARRGGK